MTSLLVDGIGELVTNDPALGVGKLGLRTNAALVIENGRVAWVGPARAASAADRRMDVAGAAVLPGFVDSHSHLVFAGDRGGEFAARMAGRPYVSGGIRTTVGATRAASDDELRANTWRLRREALRQGTTTIEIKSGYGLTVNDEARALRIARELTEETTFLGAHVVPGEYAGRIDDYVGLVTGPMLSAVAKDAKWIDVFCEPGAFDVDHARAVLVVGQAAGLGARVHANQLSPGQGVQLAVEVGAASADHCTYLSDADVDALASTMVDWMWWGPASATVATLLPGADFATRAPYPDARRLIEAGVTVALATDCNPGTSYTTSMPFCVALAVRETGMSPAEAIWSATAGGAAALRRDDVGSLRPGARADLIVLDAPSHLHLAYRPGVPLIRTVMNEGVTEFHSEAPDHSEPQPDALHDPGRAPGVSRSE